VTGIESEDLNAATRDELMQVSRHPDFANRRLDADLGE